MDYIGRHLESAVASSLDTFRVVVLHGARQCGKTTLARAAARDRGGDYVSLDDDTVRLAALDDPDALLSSLTPPAVVDEIQLGGDRVVRAVKRIVDEDNAPGRFLLTGSTNFLTVPTISESLAGRARILRLSPLSQAELAGSPPLRVERWLDDASVAAPPSDSPDRDGYLQRLCRGGYPEAAPLPADARAAWFSSYLETVVQRDIADLGDIRRASVLTDLLRWLAANSAGEINQQAACRDLGVDRATLGSYLAWLETVFLVRTVPAWSRKHAARIVRRPKLHLHDTGLAAGLLGVAAEALAAPTSTAAGSLLETFVVNELSRHLAATPQVRMHHLRDYDGHEVDIVLERADGALAAAEVKATGSPAESHLEPLRWLRDRIDNVAPGTFRLGVLLHTGRHCLPAGDRLVVAPISTLWSPNP